VVPALLQSSAANQPPDSAGSTVWKVWAQVNWQTAWRPADHLFQQRKLQTPV